jgi:outer membrane protein W
MLRKLYLVPVLALLAIPALASAQFEAGNYALELSGSGSNDQDFTTGNAAVNLNLGYFMTKELELGVRQGIVWADGGSAWSGQTVVAADWHFDMDRWQPYIGANIGYVYGDNVDDAWIAGPEAGVKYFVNSTTFVDANVAYEFNLEDGLDNGGFLYTLGLGFKW